MPFSFPARKAAPVAPVVSPQQAGNFGSAGLELAAAYRVKRPSNALLNAFKIQVGWDPLNDEGRFRLQQYLELLVEQVGGPAISFPYREAIAIDFALAPAANAHFRQHERILAVAPQMARELEASRHQVQVADERARALRSQYDDLVGEHDLLVEHCSALTRQADHLQQVLQMHREQTMRLYAHLPAPSAGMRFGGQRQDPRQRYTLAAVPALPPELAEADNNQDPQHDDRSTAASV